MTERMTQETCDLVDVAHVFTSDQIADGSVTCKEAVYAVHLESGRSEKICRELSEILVSEILSAAPTAPLPPLPPLPLMQASHIHEILAANTKEPADTKESAKTNEPYLGYDDSDTSRLRKKLIPARLDLLPHEFSILAEYVVNTIIEKSLVEYDDGIFIWDGESNEKLGDSFKRLVR